MHVCLLCTEIFSWGKHGGYGRATRMIGRELVRRGLTVSAVIPLPRGSRHPVREQLDGMTVYGYPPHRTWSSQALYREVDADIYHTEEPFIGTYLARRAMPHRAHVVTFRDPRLFGDWMTEFLHPTRSRLQVVTTSLYYNNPLVRHAVRQADGWGAAAEFLREKAQRKYGGPVDPVFLPSPVTVPDSVEKAAVPTVCFLGRLDRVKRPQLFFELAARHPEFRFIAAGASQDDSFAQALFSDHEQPENLTLTGFIDQFSSDALDRILSQCWILVNTSAKEGLPNAFIEAAAYRCAILSALDPDGFTSKFGHLVTDGDYSTGLRTLLKGDRWKALGAAGQAFVRRKFATDVVLDSHIEFYETALRQA